MAKRKRGFTKEKLKKWLKESRGQGTDSQYKPWITIQDVPSNGEATRIHGVKIDRQHDLLSRNEKNYFYIVEYADDVIDIMEQYPLLPIDQTQIIAAEIGVEHPSDPSTGEDIVLTCDFLLKVRRGEDKLYIARTIKELNELNNLRQIQKFEIERRFWQLKGIDWGIVVAEEIPKIYAKNISDVRPFYRLDTIKGLENFTESQICKLINDFKHFINNEKLIVRKVCKDFDNKLKLEPGTGIKLFKHLVWKKHIFTDMNIPLSLDKMIDIKLNSNI